MRPITDEELLEATFGALEYYAAHLKDYEIYVYTTQQGEKLYYFVEHFPSYTESVHDYFYYFVGERTLITLRVSEWKALVNGKKAIPFVYEDSFISGWIDDE